jgi:hypothetical protein
MARCCPFLCGLVRGCDGRENDACMLQLTYRDLGQARSGYATPSGGMVGGPGGARSGYATPTYSQYPVPRSMTHSGAATPTYGQTGQRYVSAGPVPYNQLPQNQAPRHPTYDQKPMLDQVNPQQQAYQQHVELIQQHRAVEAHQRLMAQRNDQVCGVEVPTLPPRLQCNMKHARLTCESKWSSHGIRNRTFIIKVRTIQCSRQWFTRSDTQQATSCRTTEVSCLQ